MAKNWVKMHRRPWRSLQIVSLSIARCIFGHRGGGCISFCPYWNLCFRLEFAHLSNFWAPELYISVPKLSDVTFTSAPACGCRSIHKTRQEIGLYYSYRLSVGRSVGVRLSATFGNLKFTCNAICLEFHLKTILLLIFVDCCAQNLTISVEKFVLRGRYFRGLSWARSI